MKRGLIFISLVWVLGYGCSAPPAATTESNATPGVPTSAGSFARDEGAVAGVGRDNSTPVEGLTLDQATEMAERFHPELALARAAVEAAEGRAAQAGTFPNPAAVARVESAPFSGRTTGDAEYVLGVSQRLPIGGRLSRASSAQELERDRLAKELEARRLQVRRRVQAALAAVLYSEEVVNAQASAVRIAEEGVAIAGARLEAGDALPEELARAEIELVRARLELDKARSLREQAMVELRTAVGNPALQVASVEGALGAILEIPTIASLATRLESSPMLTSVEADVAVQRALLNLAEAERIPDVNLDLFYRRLGESDENAFDVGIGIPIPLFDRNQGKIREARAAIRAAEARVRSTRLMLRNELQQSHARLSNALEAARIMREEILPRATTVLETTEIRYSAGDTSLAEALPVRRDYKALELAYLESLREVMQAWAALSPYLKTDAQHGAQGGNVELEQPFR